MALRPRGRDIAVIVGVIAIVIAVTWTAALVSRTSAENDQLRQDVSTLAQQVRQLGGTPHVSPSAGPAGASGSPGAPGQPGAAGASGRPGSAGSPGSPGSTGATGKTGPSGSPGGPGPSGAQGPAGPPGKDGQDGKDGATGPQGDTGQTGPPPSSWTFTYLGVTYVCSPDSAGATTYTCSPSGTALSRKN